MYDAPADLAVRSRSDSTIKLLNNLKCCQDVGLVLCCSLRLIAFEFGSGCREHAQCAACRLQSVEQLSRVWNSNMAEAVVSLPLTNLEWFQIASSHA